MRIWSFGGDVLVFLSFFLFLGIRGLVMAMSHDMWVLVRVHA